MALPRRPAELGPFSLWLSLPQLITWGSVFYTFPLLMGPMEALLGLGRAESSLAFSLALLAEGASAWLMGRWIDAGHERRVMVWGSVAVGAGLFGLSRMDSVAGFYAAWLWLGVAMAATLYSPAFAVVTRRFGTDFRRAIIILTFLGGLASTVFIPLVSWWIDLWGWLVMLVVLALIQWLVCAPRHAWLLLEAPRPLQPAARPAANDAPVRAHLRRAPFWLLTLFMVLVMLVTSALPVHMIELLQEAGLPPAWVLGIPAAIGVLQVLGRLGLFVFERRWNVHVANRWIPALLPAGLLVLVLGGLSPWAAVLFVLLYGPANGLITIVKGTAVAQYVSAAHVGQLNGLMALPTALARAAAPWLLGLMWSADGGYHLGLWWLVSAGVCAVAALWAAQRQALATAPPQP
ncbi:MAG: MFS transporter [Limnohabitans sp.]